MVGSQPYKYSTILKKLELHSGKNYLVKNKKTLKIDEGWENYRLFGTLSNKRINERNKKIIIKRYDECISIFNARCHPYLKTRLFTLGNFLTLIKMIRKHHSIIFKLEGTNIPEIILGRNWKLH